MVARAAVARAVHLASRSRGRFLPSLAAVALLGVVVGGSGSAGADAAAGDRASSAASAALVPPSPGWPVLVRDGTWYLREALSGGPATATFTYGSVGDTPVYGDWDGNGSDTVGIVRGSSWLLRNSNSGGPADITFTYGRATDIPVVGDWDGNGTYTPGVVRGSTWYLRNSNTGGGADVTFGYGRAGDAFVAGDWDGNGSFTPGVIRGASWFLRNSQSGGAAHVSFDYGRSSDRPVAGDWDANGTTTPGVVRGNSWLLRNSTSGGAADVTFGYGRANDVVLSTESALVRSWGATALRPSLVGTEMRTLPTAAKVVALTFDAGANAAGVPSILSTLRTTGTPATFFLTGAWVRNFPEQTRQIGLQYPVGNHTDTHPHLPQLSDAQVRSQITTTQSTIQAQTRYDTRPMFRFPYGESDARTLGIVNDLGYGSVRWTVDTLGWKGTSGGESVDTIVARVLNTLQPGQIILMHVGSVPADGSTLDADALPRIISELRARGYSFVTVPPYVS